MRVIRNLERARGQFSRPVVTVGNFDGVHRGHQVILRHVREDADLRGVAGIALTFEPHPVAVLRPESAPRLLMHLGDRLTALAACGVDATVVQAFTRAFAQIEADEFVRRFLVEILDTQKLVVGHDLNFGRDRAGNVERLVEAGGRYGFTVEVIRPVHVGNVVVHSSGIRRAVAQGEVALAGRLLGRPHVVRGRVTRGAGRGRGLGFATANVRPKTQAVPPDGVYVTRARIENRRVGGVTSIGNAPTFGGTGTVIETHLFAEVGELYGQAIAIEFVDRLRDQRRFESPEALQQQVQNDIARAKTILGRE